MAPIQKWNFLNACIKCFGKKDLINENQKVVYKGAYGFAHIQYLCPFAKYSVAH